MFEDRLLYYPEKTTVANLVSQRLGAWPTANDFRGLAAEPAGAVRGSAIVFHGNAGHVGHREYYATALTRLGLRVILAEYPGYGPRGGQLGERNLVDDAEETLVRVHQLYGSPLLLIGESLGAGVAAAAASHRRDKIAGLMLVTPWDRLASVAAYHLAWLPVGWLLRDHYDSITNLASFDRPVLVALAERDSIVPARFGMALYESLSAPKRLNVVSGAEHNDWIERVDENWWREAIQFLLDASAGLGIG
jgi:alpha-beta hydrolase superfamily lysophospholipase